MSDKDIEKGARWGPELSTQLQHAQIGIICLTPENMEEPWLNFEAGALSKQLDISRVCPYLFELEPTEVQYPLAGFQSAKAEKEDTRNLLHTINRAMGEEALDDGTLNSSFDVWWETLANKLSQVNKQPHAAAREKRSEADMLEELVTASRQEIKERRKILEGLAAIFEYMLEQRSGANLRSFAERLFSEAPASALDFPDRIRPPESNKARPSLLDMADRLNPHPFSLSNVKDKVIPPSSAESKENPKGKN
jgi:hypothetical protein